jgi:hypothetical protein
MRRIGRYLPFFELGLFYSGINLKKQKEKTV